jgi:hypothetical protein
MLEITSAGCGNHHHAQFRLRFDPNLALERDAGELVARLEQGFGSRPDLKSGSYFQHGWLTLRLNPESRNILTVQEPDFQGLPVRYADSVTNALRHLAWQRACATAIGFRGALVHPTMSDTAAVCPRIGRSRDFILERSSPAPNDSGWTIGCSDTGHDHKHGADLTRMTLYEAVTRFRPEIAAFFALPPGAKILNGPHGLWISLDGRSHQIPRGSFLDQLMNPSPASSAVIMMDAGHNLLQSPPGTPTLSYSIPAAQRLVLRRESSYEIPVPAEVGALGINQPNTVVLLTKTGQQRHPWTSNAEAGFEVPISSVPGDELILILGYVDDSPASVTKGGIAALWSAQVRLT